MTFHDVMDGILKGLAQGLLSLAAGAAIWLFGQVSAWMRARTKNTLLAGAISLGEHLADVVVQAQQAKLRPLLADPGVKLDAAQAKKIYEAAVTEFVAIAQSEGTAVANKLLSMGQDYFAGLIETSVAKMKRSDAVVAAVAAAPAPAAAAAVVVTSDAPAPSPQ